MRPIALVALFCLAACQQPSGLTYEEAEAVRVRDRTIDNTDRITVLEQKVQRLEISNAELRRQNVEDLRQMRELLESQRRHLDWHQRYDQ